MDASEIWFRRVCPPHPSGAGEVSTSAEPTADATVRYWVFLDRPVFFCDKTGGFES
ncbi:MAG: hypothetical protein ABSG22_08815 [Sedimentisphaerales bacterium]